MQKILKLKDWYSLEDAAKRLSLTLQDEIIPKDLLNIAIDGKISLYWYMRHVTAQKVEYSEREFTFFKDELGNLHPKKIEKGIPIKILSGSFKPIEEFINHLDGAYKLELELCGALKDHIIQFTTGIPCELVSLDGFFVSQDTVIYQILEPFDDRPINDRTPLFRTDNYYPSANFPDYKELGFIRAELEALENALNKPQKTKAQSKDLGTREKETLLKIIIGMAIEQYGYDPKATKNEAVSNIVADLAAHSLSIDEDTVRNKLKDASKLFGFNKQDTF